MEDQKEPLLRKRFKFSLPTCLRFFHFAAVGFYGALTIVALYVIFRSDGQTSAKFMIEILLPCFVISMAVASIVLIVREYYHVVLPNRSYDLEAEAGMRVGAIVEHGA